LPGSDGLPRGGEAGDRREEQRRSNNRRKAH
jgi:hypothetical protein